MNCQREIYGFLIRVKITMKKITLAWQEFKNGTRHVRRIGIDNDSFHGFELQTEYVLDWLENCGNPEWPDYRPLEGLLSKCPPIVYEEIQA